MFCLELFPFQVYIIICQIQCIHDIALVRAGEYRCGDVISIGAREDEDAIARHLYGILRKFDDLDVDTIYSESFESEGLGQAIMNRLLKAAGHKVVTL